MSRWRAYGVGLSLSAAVATPALSSSREDSYPLSRYPMFAARHERVSVHRLVGVRGGTRTPLPPSLVVGSLEVMQAAKTIRHSAHGGPEEATRLCELVADRARRTAPWQDLETVELVVQDHEPVTYFTERTAPTSRQVLTRCTVSGHL